MLTPIIFALGIAFGSFLSMLIPRIRKSESGIFLGRSHCIFCKKNLEARDMVPVLSYFWNRAKCRFCNKKISALYPIIEILTGIIFVLIYLKFPVATLAQTPETIFYLLISLALIFTFFYDLKYLEISDLVLVPAIILALIGTLLPNTPSFTSALLGVAIGIGFFLIQIIISKGKWVGAGDIRIGALMGAVLGWQLTLVALVLSYLIGSVFSVPILITGKKQLGEKVPLGPFLVMGTFLTIFLGEKILAWYLSLAI
ncbi:MAG: prepilin peptidase [Patescibacteria group bacterium]|nr:prepilin peptidase [Patescibacteria group bacterium]